MAGNYIESQTPIMQNGDFYYPLTTAKQTILPDGRRLGGENGLNITADDVNALSIDLADAKQGVATGINADMLGGKAPGYYLQPRNLLDNSDFTNPVNQRGVTTNQPINGAGASLDRWLLWDTTEITPSLTIDPDGIVFTTATSYFQQRTPLGILDKNKQYTLAVYYTNGTVNAYKNVVGYTEGFAYINTLGAVEIGKKVKAFALYEGSYTTETLPPYVPKGYGAELMECRRYYQRYAANGSEIPNNLILNGFISSDSSAIYVAFPISSPMRSKPSSTTLTSGGVIVRWANGYCSEASYTAPYTDYRITSTYGDGYSFGFVIKKKDGTSWAGVTNNTPVCVIPYGGSSELVLSADL